MTSSCLHSLCALTLAAVGDLQTLFVGVVGLPSPQRVVLSSLKSRAVD